MHPGLDGITVDEPADPLKSLYSAKDQFGGRCHSNISNVFTLFSDMQSTTNI
jgi:hypothetical protein